MTPETVLESLVWQAPPWQVLLAAGAAIVGFGAAMRGGAGTSPGLRLIEGTALAVALALLVVGVARPTWVIERETREPGRVAVLIDASRSMSVREKDRARSDIAQARIAEIGTENVDYYHFGGDLAPGLPSSWDLATTDVGAALHNLAERTAGDKLAAVVILTDGLDRGNLRRSWQESPDAMVPELPGPLTLVQIGSAADLQDIAVRHVDAGGFAFVHGRFTVKAELEAAGFANTATEVALLRDGSEVARQKVALDGKGKGLAVFEVVPNEAGRFTYTAKLTRTAPDAVPGNDSASVVVRVVRDKLRVLQVTGAPSWDVKFLRRFLKEDPSVDLVSFFILRTKKDSLRDYDDSELSLIEFPYKKLFSEDLAQFDLVILQNFNYAPYFETRADQTLLLGKIRDFVEQDGHALVMVGGDRSFSLGDYQNTPVEEILPFALSDEKSEPDVAPFQAALTDAGARHPVTRLLDDAVENAAWWGRLHGLDGTNTGHTARADATVLLTHPTLTDGAGKPLPILAVREAGRGRTMALTADTSWRWSFSEAAEGRGNQAYLRFWKSAMRWLVGDGSAQRVEVEASRENYQLGDTVRLVVRARTPSFDPQPGARVVATVVGPTELPPLDGLTDADGELVLTLPAAERGAFRVKVDVSHASAKLGVASTVYAVTTRDPELDEVVPDGAFLGWWAERAGGTHITPDQPAAITRDAEAGRVSKERIEEPLGRSPWLAGAVLALSGVAWIARRRRGFR